jgi:hypothetical protein
MSDISNKTLAILVGIAIVISLVGILSISKGGIRYISGKGTTGPVSFNASSEASILVTNSIDFGTGRVNRTQVNATLDSAAGTFAGAELGTANIGDNNWVTTSLWSRYIAVENDGTVNVSVNVTANANNNAAGLIGGTGPEFQLKGIATEAESCVTLSTTYTNVPNSTETPYPICNKLYYGFYNDTFNVSARIVIPSDAKAGPRNATLTFSASQVT